MAGAVVASVLLAAVDVDDDGADDELDGESADFFAAHPVRQAAVASVTAIPDDSR
jgi:hypothetical protein